MHGGWYTGGMGALGASSGLQGGFSTAGSLGGGVVPHSQHSYHLGLGSMVSQLALLPAISLSIALFLSQNTTTTTTYYL